MAQKRQGDSDHAYTFFASFISTCCATVEFDAQKWPLWGVGLAHQPFEANHRAALHQTIATLTVL